MRGTAGLRKSGNLYCGITPACAGNRSICISAGGRSGDHPRVCGEQPAGDQRAVSILGSPPRVRGTEKMRPVRLHVLRITPACAGNSPPEWSEALDSKDHPRVCGEQVQQYFFYADKGGSPPRVRGTGTYRGLMTKRYRITPACAGNSNTLIQPPPSWRDHPRVCGEQTGKGRAPGGELGSPPRVRGTAYLPCFPPMVIGITPACAGNRVFSKIRGQNTWDHPRVCGEQRRKKKESNRLLGSPPRVRGTAVDATALTADNRITPACAGNS